MDEKLFQCGICLELCHQCINCLKCNQIFCRTHVKDLPEDRCPSCRDAPFRYQENVALQRIIRDLREKAGLPEPPPSPRESQEPVSSRRVPRRRPPSMVRGSREELVSSDRVSGRREPPREDPVSSSRVRRSRRRDASEERTAPPVVRRDTSEEEVPEDNGYPLLEMFGGFFIGTSNDPEIVDPRIGTKVPCRGRPNEFQKKPSDHHADVMKRHCRTCTNEGCRTVWNGPWGQFIGGRQGSTHFDLTECSEGARLNRQIGWNYDDPRK